MKKMNNSPKVSVVIPLFNQKEFIGDAINSILGQSYKNIEIIVVNDGSTDHPEDVLSDYMKDIIIINQENRGLSGARNSGILRAEGDYIQLLDADDLLTEYKIEKQLECFRDGNSALPYCRIRILHNEDSSLSEWPDPVIEDMFSHYYLLWKPYPTPIHSLLFPAELFRKNGLFDDRLKANEDRYFLAKLAFSGIRFSKQNLIGGFYRKHSGCMTADPPFIAETMLDFYRIINADLGDRFFRNKYGYSASEMLRANITYFYLFHLRLGSGRKILNKIRELMEREGATFFADPLESRFQKNKMKKMLVSCYLKRYANMFKEKLQMRRRS